MYYSNEDFENFYVRYKEEGLPQNLSIQQFCIQNKVSWNLFNKWYRDTRHRIKEVTVSGRPENQAEDTQPSEDLTNQPKTAIPVEKSTESEDTRIMVDIKMSNGLHVFQKNLSYRKLLTLVENLEVLC